MDKKTHAEQRKGRGDAQPGSTVQIDSTYSHANFVESFFFSFCILKKKKRKKKTNREREGERSKQQGPILFIFHGTILYNKQRNTHLIVFLYHCLVGFCAFLLTWYFSLCGLLVLGNLDWKFNFNLFSSIWRWFVFVGYWLFLLNIVEREIF